MYILENLEHFFLGAFVLLSVGAIYATGVWAGWPLRDRSHNALDKKWTLWAIGSSVAVALFGFAVQVFGEEVGWWYLRGPNDAYLLIAIAAVIALVGWRSSGWWQPSHLAQA